MDSSIVQIRTLKMSLWRAVVVAIFHRLRWKHFEKLYVLEFAAKLLGGPPCFPLVYWMNSWFRLVYCSGSSVISSLVQAYWRAADKGRIFARPSKIACSQKPIGVKLRTFSVVLECGWRRTLQYSAIYFSLYRRENGKYNSSSENLVKNQ